MNPFANIAHEDRLTENKNSPHYERYELKFDQVFPFREPLYGQLVLKLNDQVAAEQALIIYKQLPEMVQVLVDIQKQQTVRKKYNFFSDEDHFILIYQFADKTWLALENLYFMFQEFARLLEDCHFFISDQYAYWIDEYKIKNRSVTFQRHQYDNDHYYGLLDFYLTRAIENPANFVFMRFTLYQLYEEMTFRLHEYLKIGITTKDAAINLVAELAYNADMVQHTTIEEDAKPYFQAFYNLDKTCSDWTSLNKKYNLI